MDEPNGPLAAEICGFKRICAIAVNEGKLSGAESPKYAVPGRKKSDKGAEDQESIELEKRCQAST